MDRSFLSRPEVVKASRKFVCVRLTTYEDKDEAKFLKAFDVTRSGEVENTVFTILSPDGKKRLTGAGRSARMVFDDAAEMAGTMNKLAARYTKVKDENTLPLVGTVRLAVNVASCDNQPLVVLVGKDAKSLAALEKSVSTLAWGKEFVGRFVYASTTDVKTLSAITGVKAGSSILVVQPDQYGQKGKVLAQTSEASAENMTKALRDALKTFKATSKTFRSHVRAGHEAGVFWETAIPVTDPMEKRARERGKTRKK